MVLVIKTNRMRQTSIEVFSYLGTFQMSLFPGVLAGQAVTSRVAHDSGELLVSGDTPFHLEVARNSQPSECMINYLFIRNRQFTAGSNKQMSCSCYKSSLYYCL